MSTIPSPTPELSRYVHAQSLTWMSFLVSLYRIAEAAIRSSLFIASRRWPNFFTGISLAKFYGHLLSTRLRKCLMLIVASDSHYYEEWLASTHRLADDVQKNAFSLEQKAQNDECPWKWNGFQKSGGCFTIRSPWKVGLPNVGKCCFFVRNGARFRPNEFAQKNMIKKIDRCGECRWPLTKPPLQSWSNAPCALGA